jgi:hypothetical protein
MLPSSQLRIHCDAGANHSVTNDLSLLTNFKNIKKLAMNGIAENTPAIYCTGIGYLPWVSNEGYTLLVRCYYSAQAAETIISPNDIVITNCTDYYAWCQHSNLDNSTGYIEFQSCQGPSIHYSLQADNGLWYYTGKDTSYQPWYNNTSTVRKLTIAA